MRERRRTDHDVSSEDGRLRLYDRRFKTNAVRLPPGDHYTTGAPDEMIVTVLGSCVAACVRNPHSGYGGMNHFMLPESSSGDWLGASASMRYGTYAMEVLINDVLKSGCSRQDLEIKLFGGANFQAGTLMVGWQNADFALRYLEAEGLRVVAADLGGTDARRIHYFPSTGKVFRLYLRRTEGRGIVDEERRYRDDLQRAPVEGPIELFE